MLAAILRPLLAQLASEAVFVLLVQIPGLLLERLRKRVPGFLLLERAPHLLAVELRVHRFDEFPWPQWFGEEVVSAKDHPLAHVCALLK